MLADCHFWSALIRKLSGIGIPVKVTLLSAEVGI